MYNQKEANRKPDHFWRNCAIGGTIFFGVIFAVAANNAHGKNVPNTGYDFTSIKAAAPNRTATPEHVVESEFATPQPPVPHLPQ